MDLSTEIGRKKAIAYIESNDNLGRKAETYKQNEIYNDRIKQFVINNLREQFSEQSVKEMPVVSSVNIAKRVVNQLASIYREEPERDWEGLSDDQKEIAFKIYSEMKANKKLSMANRYFKLHKQCLLWMIPQDGKLTLRVLHPYQWDAIPNAINPEIADAIIISAYDNYNELRQAGQPPATPTGFSANADTNTKNYKQALSFEEQEKQRSKRYLIWTAEFNVVCDGMGEIVGEIEPNPIGELPFIEISEEKEFEYWVRQSNQHTNFTVEFNARMSEVAQVVKMQGFAQAIIKGPREMLMENYQIGPNFIIKLPVDAPNEIETSFEYANPGSDISGSIRFLETQLSAYLTAEGIDPKTVSLNGESQSYSSGLERLLAMLDKFSASQSDYDTFRYVEDKIWDLIVKWQNALSNADNLRQELRLGSIPSDSEVTVKFARPELVMSEADQLDLAQRRIDLGISSPIREIERIEGVSYEEAVDKYRQYQEETFGVNQPSETIPE